MYLYGSPRVGDPYLAQAFHQQDAASNVYRIANTMDIVTDLPPSLDFDSVKYTHITGLNYTYEFIPLDESIMNLTRADFLAWAHSLSTYRAFLEPIFDVSRDVTAWATTFLGSSALFLMSVIIFVRNLMKNRTLFHSNPDIH